MRGCLVALCVCVLLSLTCGVVSVSGQRAGTQYLANGGFESGRLAPWTAKYDVVSYVVSIFQSSSAFQSHSGGYSLAFFPVGDVPTGVLSIANLTQTVQVPSMAGEQFFLSLWYLLSPYTGLTAPTATVFALLNGVMVAVTNVSQTVGGAGNNGYIQYMATISQPTPTIAGQLANLTLIVALPSAARIAQLDDITLIGPSVTGDPQFIGLRGQSYQVHGMDGEVYNLITDKSVQVNSRFVFLSEGTCPIVNGKAAKDCWSHPGSYLGAIGVQQVVDGKVEQLAIEAGSHSTGFSSIRLNGDAMKVGDSYSNGGVFSVSYKSMYVIEVITEHYTFRFENSDMFVNQQVKANIPLADLTSHGLFGQTHQRKLYNSALRYIEGEVDDYVVASQDLFGTDCMYNKFSL